MPLLQIDGLGKLPFPDETFDFCFSYITFHHIPIKSVVRSFIDETHRVLKVAGVARWHFFGRPEGILASIRESVTHKDTWRGCKFTLSEVTAAVRAAGLKSLPRIMSLRNPGACLAKRLRMSFGSPHASPITRGAARPSPASKRGSK